MTVEDIPKGWRKEKLIDVCDIYLSNVDKKCKSSEKIVLLCNYLDVYKNRYITGKMNFMRASASDKEISKFKLKKGDILITKDSETPDDIAIPSVVNEQIENLICGYHLALIRPDRKKINSLYLMNAFTSDTIRTYARRKANGLTRFSLGLKTIQEIPILLPPLSEQEKISNILTTIDDNIFETYRIVDECERIKKGLMQTLLTKGMPGKHKKFKKTKLGEIPEEWKLATFDEVISYLKSGLSRLLNSEDVGVPCIRSTNIIDGKIDCSDLKYWYLEDDQGANVKSYFLDEGDLLLNFINSAAQIGKTCVYHSIGRDVIYTTNIFRIKVNKNVILSKYFYYYTLTNKYQQDIQSITKPAVNQASFTSKDFKKLRMPLPSLQEQAEIVKIIDTFDVRIMNEILNKQQLIKLKLSLMQKLLSGEIRVEV